MSDREQAEKAFDEWSKDNFDPKTYMHTTTRSSAIDFAIAFAEQQTAELREKLRISEEQECHARNHVGAANRTIGRLLEAQCGTAEVNNETAEKQRDTDAIPHDQWVETVADECEVAIRAGLDHTMHNAPGRVALANAALDRMMHGLRRLVESSRASALECARAQAELSQTGVWFRQGLAERDTQLELVRAALREISNRADTVLMGPHTDSDVAQLERIRELASKDTQ